MRTSWRVPRADVSKYFASIPHTKLLATVAERVADGAMLHLLRLWLKAPVVSDEGGQRRNLGGGQGNRKGTPQGGVISPLLSNLYLHLLDRNWEDQKMEERHQARLVRYADDFVVLRRRQTDVPMRTIRRLMGGGTGTEPERGKDASGECLAGPILLSGIRAGDCAQRACAYRETVPAGEPIEESPQGGQGPSDSADDAYARAGSTGRPDPPDQSAAAGMGGYFHHHNCSKAMSEVKTHAEQRMRIWLRNRHKVRSWKAGYQRFSSACLYADYGLYKVPTTAGWTAEAHA